MRFLVLDTKGKNDVPQSQYVMERPHMSPEELKSKPKGSFVVIKTDTHPMKNKFKQFFDWGIQFLKSLEMPERGSRPVHNVWKMDLERTIWGHHPMKHMPMNVLTPFRVTPSPQPMLESTFKKHR